MSVKWICLSSLQCKFLTLLYSQIFLRGKTQGGRGTAIHGLYTVEVCVVGKGMVLKLSILK